MGATFGVPVHVEPERLLLTRVRRARSGARTDADEETPTGDVLQRRGHRREDARVAVGDVHHERSEHDVGHDCRERAEDGPALEHFGGVVDAAVDVVVDPDAGEAGVDHRGCRVAHVGPARTERVQQGVDVEMRACLERHSQGLGRNAASV